MTTKVTMLIDLQYGSTGKGLAASYLCMQNKYDAVISANLPNAGHTAYDNRGTKFVHKILPSGVFCRPKVVMVGPGAVFSTERLEQELAHLENSGYGVKVIIHDCATVLQPEHVAVEANGAVRGIASTAQGSMAAQCAKMARDKDKKVIARDIDLGIPSVMKVNNQTWQGIIASCEHILAEGAQGYSLGINQQFYPYCTSRDCSPSRFMSDMALPWGTLNKVVGVARTFPIRVGNTEHGHSGDCYPDQEETTWDAIGQVPETTTVTGRVRRVFTFSIRQIQDAVRECMPTSVFLNFANYVNNEDLSHLIKLINGCGTRVDLLGYGPLPGDVIRIDPWEHQSWNFMTN